MAEEKKALLVSLGLPEEAAAIAVATDADDGYKADKTPTSMFYTLKVNDDADVTAVKENFMAYTKAAKGSKGHLSVSHTYNEETKELVCIEVITGKDAMNNHIGNCFPPYAKMLGAGAVMTEILAVVDPSEIDWWKASMGAWQPSRMVVNGDQCP